MAKIRVYELARDLNMTNKALLDKIRGMAIAVKSHMSSLDDETVTVIKAGVLGKQTREIEETRVRPTIIRRRRKAPTEVEPAETEVAETEATAPSPPEEAPVVVRRRKAAPAEEPVAPETDRPAEESVRPSAVADTGPAEPAPPVVTSQTPTASEEDTARASREAPAGEVAPAAAIEGETAPPVDELAAAAGTPPTAADTAADMQTTDGAAAVSDTPSAAEDSPPTRAEETSRAGEAPGAPEADDESGAAEEAVEPAAGTASKRPTPPKRKGKKDAPAKIIKLPETPPAPPAPPARERPAGQPGWSPKVVAQPAIQPAESEPETGARRKKGRRQPAEVADSDRKFSKKRISFRRKEVVEGADLYGGGARGRKGRKAGKGKAAASGHKPQITTPKAIKRRIKIDDTIILAELAKRMGIKAGDMIRSLMSLGVMATVNQTIDFDTAVLVAGEFGYEVERAAFEEESLLKVEQTDDPAALAPRPPVVTVMGHVDHGKTSLLDVIRKTRVTENEAGGITQHIGAYNVQTTRGQVVFLDTPGHEAFTAMRARGSRVTDLVVLVVAADDGVMPQTIEAVNHAKAADVPIIVAVNKMDKPDADPDRVKRQLSEAGLTPEDWGGETICVHVSAKQNTGIDELLEMILLQAEMLELKANPDKLALGHVVEARLDAGRGPVATVLVQEGTLKTGEPVVCGLHYGRIRAMINDLGVPVQSAGPSIPVEIIGLSGVPNAGDEFIVVEDEKNAKQVSSHRIQKQRAAELAKNSRMSLENLFQRLQENQIKDLSLILKADVQGSIEALQDSLVKLSNEEVKIHIAHAATGAISESDISLAAVSDAIIIGFNVRPSAKVQALANEENVDLRYYNVIYNVITDVKNAIAGLMASTYEEVILGHVEVREVFQVPKVGAVAGCYVLDGKIERGRNIRLMRNGVVVYDGKIASLRRFKDDVKEVQHGYECGIGLEKYNDIKVGDEMECFYLEEKRPELV